MKNKNTKKIISFGISLFSIASCAAIVSGVTVYNLNKKTYENNENILSSNESVNTNTNELDNKSPFDLSTATITFKNLENLRYTGSYVYPEFEVIASDGTVLREDIDYNLTFENNINAGEGTLHIWGERNGFYGHLQKNFPIQKAIDNVIKMFYVVDSDVPVDVAKYGEVKFKYSPNLVDWYYELPVGDDNNNFSSFWYVKCYVEEGPNYYGTESENSIWFLRKKSYDISKCRVVINNSVCEYTGKYIKPELTIYDVNNSVLNPMTDYNVEVSNNLNVGTATYKIIGKGKYKGTRLGTITIQKAKNEISDVEFYHNEARAFAKIGEVKYRYSNDLKNWSPSFPTLREGDWYVQAYVEETENYYGVESAPLKFKAIPKRDLAYSEIKILDKGPFVYDGKTRFMPKIDVFDTYLQLVEGFDYTIEYGNNIHAGEGHITVRGMGKYSNTINTVSFTIEKAKNEVSEIIWKNNEPFATAKFGNVNYRYSKDQINWTYDYPLQKGEYYAQAIVVGTNDYDEAVSPNNVKFYVE